MYKKIVHTISFFILWGFTVLMSCGCSGSTGEDVLKVGVRSDVINFGYYNENTQKFYGMEIDLAQELAKRIGYDAVDFISVDPSDRERELESGEVDCLIACYTITPERQEKFDISSPYYADSIVIMVEDSSMIDNARQFPGKKIGVLEGSTTAQQVTARLFEQGIVTDYSEDSFDAAEYRGGITFCEMASYEELITALEEGSIDAVSTDGCILQQYKTEERHYVDIGIAKQFYGIALMKDSVLTAPVEEALQDMYSDGSMEMLIDKWE